MEDVQQALLAFTAAATVLTVTPGLDTALVLRAATAEGSRTAILAGIGICLGCLVWGALVAFGLGALISASELAYTVLKFAGAGYLFYLGILLIRGAHSGNEAAQGEGVTGSYSWFRRGLLTNLLNPKVGVFYTAFLPQFVPHGASVGAMTMALAFIHAALGLLWFVGLALATLPLARLLRRPAVGRWLDRSLGGIMIFIGVRLVVSARE